MNRYGRNSSGACFISAVRHKTIAIKWLIDSICHIVNWAMNWDSRDRALFRTNYFWSQIILWTILIKSLHHQQIKTLTLITATFFHSAMYYDGLRLKVCSDSKIICAMSCQIIVVLCIFIAYLIQFIWTRLFWSMKIIEIFMFLITININY